MPYYYAASPGRQGRDQPRHHRNCMCEDCMEELARGSKEYERERVVSEKPQQPPQPGMRGYEEYCAAHRISLGWVHVGYTSEGAAMYGPLSPRSDHRAYGHGGMPRGHPAYGHGGMPSRERYPPGMGPAMRSRGHPGMRPGMGRGMHPGMNYGRGQGMGPGMHENGQPGAARGDDDIEVEEATEAEQRSGKSADDWYQFAGVEEAD